MKSQSIKSHVAGGVPTGRALWVWLHRWVGLVIALFLLVAGITGSLLAWFEELDALVAPQLHTLPFASQQAAPLAPLEIRERALQQLQLRYPGVALNYVPLHMAAGSSVKFYVDAPDDQPQSIQQWGFDEVYVDPATGKVLAKRLWGDIAAGTDNLMPFIYRLHYSLALGTVGTYLFGIVALLWTLDCFVGAWLTLPVRRKPSARTKPVSWWSRWKPAWKVRWRGGSYKLNFDLHRAGGLWVWAMLFVLAWSSVAFNLREVYAPVTHVLFEYKERDDGVVALPQPLMQPAIGWQQALDIGRAQMAALAQRENFTIHYEQSLRYLPAYGAYEYAVMSGRDVSATHGATRVAIDAGSGALLRTELPSGQYSGNTVSNWLYALHMATVGGTPYRVFVCAMGLVVAMLSGTGAIIWWRKRSARLASAGRRSAAIAGKPGRA